MIFVTITTATNIVNSKLIIAYKCMQARLRKMFKTWYKIIADQAVNGLTA
jgi:hypothetical protein